MRTTEARFEAYGVAARWSFRWRRRRIRGRAEEEGGHASKRAPRSLRSRRRRRRRRRRRGVRAIARGGRTPGAGRRGGVTLELVELVVELVAEVVALLAVLVLCDGRERRRLVQEPARTVAETPGTTVAGATGDGGRAVLAPQRRGRVGSVRSARGSAPFRAPRRTVGTIRRGSRAGPCISRSDAAALRGRDVRDSRSSRAGLV